MTEQGESGRGEEGERVTEQGQGERGRGEEGERVTEQGERGRREGCGVWRGEPREVWKWEGERNSTLCINP